MRCWHPVDPRIVDAVARAIDVEGQRAGRFAGTEWALEGGRNPGTVAQQLLLVASHRHRQVLKARGADFRAHLCAIRLQ